MFPSVAVIARRKPTQFLFNTLNPFLKTSHHLRLLLLLRSLHHKPINNEQEKPNYTSFTVSYLMNSCDFSPQSASEEIKIETTEKPDSNLALLKSHGFSDAQIARLVSIHPRLLSSEWEKFIKPKLDYLLSVGYSKGDVRTLVSSNPVILRTSLQKKLKPNFDLLRPVFSSSQELADAIRRSSAWLLTIKLEANFLPNVRILKAHGVPSPHIAKLASVDPRKLMRTTPARLKSTLESLGKMGFNPLSTMFVHGLRVVISMNPSTWERKAAFYRSMGWSEAEFISAFRKHPMFMSVSEEKVKRVMDFAAKRMNWGPSYIAAYPVLLTYSLEKRIAPRHSVMRLLESKGLVKSASVQFCLTSEANFLNKFVIRYQDRVPELLHAKGNSECVDAASL